MLKKKGIIGVAFHKKYFSYEDDIITPIYVGAKINKENLKYLKDLREIIFQKKMKISVNLQVFIGFGKM